MVGVGRVGGDKVWRKGGKTSRSGGDRRYRVGREGSENQR